MDNLDKILEGILFLSGDGVDKGVIMEKLQVTPKQLDKAIEILRKRYDDNCGITFITYKDKLQLCGNPKFADDVSAVLNPIRERQLTKATLEVMAIVAYKQPVTRIDVQDIRGTNSDYALQTLLNYKLIEVVGRKDAVGKPLLFGTTDLFLRHFGINSLDELPDYSEIMKNVEELKLQNNHLYNEFEIPDDEENTQNQNDNNQTTGENVENNLYAQESKQTNNFLHNTTDLKTQANQNKNELASEILQSEVKSQKETKLQNKEKLKDEVKLKNEAKLQDTPLEDLIDDNSHFNTDDNLSSSTGIDYSLLQDNTDIEK
ncbi:MAG: SMC-Scp complex subunit ScpB [Christensenellales bacterium]